MSNAAESTNQTAESLRDQVRRAVIWRSGSQIVGQLIAWASTFLVIRILAPADYGLFAMTQVVLVLLNMLNGYGLASGLIQQETITPRQVRQLFGMLILLNGGLALLQITLAPVAAAYYHQPMVAQLLRVQALLYIPTPFIALPYALLAREMDFAKQAKVNLGSAVLSAAAALAGALGGLGVWTLVLAPLVQFFSRAVGMTLAARSLTWPSFDFRGAGALARYGWLMAAGQLFWFAQSQADVFIAGRHFSAHTLGLYTISLFLVQIMVSKFVPALNDVAFSAYARIQRDDAAIANGFLRAARLILVAAMPFYFGLAAATAPIVGAALGPKYMAAVPLVRMLALAMPFMTLQVLLAPACEARGRPGIGAENGATGAAIMIAAFLVGVQWGPIGLAWAWLAGYPLYLTASLWRTLPIIGVRLGQLVAAVLPPVLAAAAMGAVVVAIDGALPPVPVIGRLLLLVGMGALVYGGWLWLFSGEVLRELWAVARKQPLPT